MKRIIATIILLCAAAAFAGAQETRHYILTCGDNSTNVDWTVQKVSGGFKSTIITGDRKEYFTMNDKFETSEYHVIDPATDTDATVTRQGDTYTFKGKNHGKSIDRTEKSDGLPWYQNVEFNGLKVADGKKPVKYECIRYTEMDRHQMQVTIKGEEEVEGIKAVKVRATLTGILSGVWGCDYYFDAKTGLFVVYKAVEGGPGTPETVIKPAK